MPEKNSNSIKRKNITLNIFLQTILFLLIIIIINIFSYKNNKQWDFSKNNKYKISQKTTKIIKSLNDKTEIIVVFNRKNPLYEDIKILVEEMKRKNKKKIKLTYIDPIIQIDKANRLANRINYSIRGNVVIVKINKNHQIVPISSMISDNTLYREHNSIDGLKGEEAITKAILKAKNPNPQNIYVLTGLRNPVINISFNNLKNQLSKQNVNLKNLPIDDNFQIPKDTSALLIIGPKTDLNTDEIEKIKEYSHKNGSLLVMLDPSSNTPNLDQFLAEHGVSPRKDIILKNIKNKGISLVVKALILDGHPVIKQFAMQSTLLPPISKSISIKNNNNQNNFQIFPLIVTYDEKYWGEKNTSDILLLKGKKKLNKIPKFNPETDLKDNLHIAVAIEKGKVDKNIPVNLEKTKMIVIGNSMLSDTVARPQNQINYDFVISCINWLIEREDLISIQPKEYYSFGLNLKKNQFIAITFFSIAIPIFILLLGILLSLFRY